MGGDDSDRASGPDLDRLTAYTYLTVPDRRTYIAILRIFTSTLLADLSAHEVAERLPGNSAADAVAIKLDYLKTWGNLLPSSRPVKASSIREYQRARSRFQLSPLGERIQRQADEVLASADAAREVSREMLGLVSRGFQELLGSAQLPGGADPSDSLERISTLFAQFGQFADSVRDFYAFLGQVIFRYDLDSDEFSGFKELLLDYAETITDDVAFFAPQIAAAVAAVLGGVAGRAKARLRHRRLGITPPGPGRVPRHAGAALGPPRPGARRRRPRRDPDRRRGGADWP